MKDNPVIPLLQEAYARELETVQNYLANSVWLDGLRAHEVAEALAKDVDEDLGHARMIAHRLKQLGACPAGSFDLKCDQEMLQPPADPTDFRQVVEGVLEAEKSSIAVYRKIFDACAGVDALTQDVALKILADEEEHRCLFEGFLKSMNKS